MFYLGGLTLGYLTPYPTVPETAAPLKVAKSKPVSQQRPEKTAPGNSDASEARPILWPWHIFY